MSLFVFTISTLRVRVRAVYSPLVLLLLVVYFTTVSVKSFTIACNFFCYSLWNSFAHNSNRTATRWSFFASFALLPSSWPKKTISCGILEFQVCGWTFHPKTILRIFQYTFWHSNIGRPILCASELIAKTGCGGSRNIFRIFQNIRCHLLLKKIKHPNSKLTPVLLRIFRNLKWHPNLWDANQSASTVCSSLAILALSAVCVQRSQQETD